jgi:hypothetical protein
VVGLGLDSLKLEALSFSYSWILQEFGDNLTFTSEQENVLKAFISF